jgi:hypothetical protein
MLLFCQPWRCWPRPIRDTACPHGVDTSNPPGTHSRRPLRARRVLNAAAGSDMLDLGVRRSAAGTVAMSRGGSFEFLSDAAGSM